MRIYTAASQDIGFIALNIHVMNLAGALDRETDRQIHVRCCRAAAILYIDAAHQNNVGDFVWWQKRMNKPGDVDKSLPQDKNNNGDDEENEESPNPVAHELPNILAYRERVGNEHFG